MISNQRSRMNRFFALYIAAVLVVALVLIPSLAALAAPDAAAPASPALAGSALAQPQAMSPALWLPLLIRAKASAPVPTATPSSPTSAPVPAPGGDVRTGEATYYDADGGGNCSFPATPDNLMVAAMNQSDYDNAALCGAFVEISGPDGVVTVRIVDRCPECPRGNVDLSPQAFAKIAEIKRGRVPITWRVVSPEIGGPIVYHFKDGSSRYWTAVQIRNHRNSIAKFEYRTESGDFKALDRVEYNYFIESKGMGPGPYTFRVTDIYGHTLTDSAIALKVDGDVPGDRQFPAP